MASCAVPTTTNMVSKKPRTNSNIKEGIVSPGRRKLTVENSDYTHPMTRGCQEKKHPRAPLGDAGGVTYTQPHLIPHRMS